MSPVLVGRDTEVQTLFAAVSATPAVVTIEGEAGVGKSRLVAELQQWPDAPGPVLIGACHAVREPFPLGPVIEAIRRSGGDLRGLRLAPIAGAVRLLLPELADVLPLAPESLDDRVAERHRVFRGLVEIVTALSPMVLVFEDVHWADQQTGDFIAYLLADPPPRLALVLTYRLQEVAPEIRALTARVTEATRHTTIPLRPLTRAGASDLTCAILDVEQVSEEFSGFLWELTGGLPLAVEEVLALVRSQGVVVRREGQWSRRSLERLEVPRRIHDLTVERVSRLPADARGLVEAAAVLHGPAPVPVLAATADDPSAVDGLAAALGSGLLVEHGSAIGFRHALSAQAVYETLPSYRREILHDRAVAAWRTRDPAPLGQVAYHLHRTDRRTEWAVAAEQAAEQAVAAGDDDEAVRLLAEVARDAGVRGEHRGRIAVRLGWAALDTLHAADVISELDDALTDDLPASVRGELRFLLAVALGQAGTDLRRQRRLYIDAIDDLGDRPDLQAWAMVAISLATPPEIPLSDDAEWLTRAVDLAARIDDPLLEVFVLGKAGSVLLDTGSPVWRDVADRVVAITNGAPRMRREANAYYSLGVAACYAGHLDTARSMLTRALDAPAAAENRRLEMMIRSALVLLRYCRGDWEGLRDEAARTLSDVGDEAMSRIDVEVALGCLDLAHGDVDDARERLLRVVAHTENISAYDVLPFAAAALIRASLAHDAIDEALACVDKVSVLERKGIWAHLGWVLPDAVEVLVVAGRHDDAQAFVARVAAAIPDLDAPVATAAVRQARGLLTGVANVVSHAADQYDALDLPYEAARARERAARLLVESDGPDAAAPLVTDVMNVYRRLGAEWDRSRAASLARSHGIAVPRTYRGGQRGYGTELSPRERQVAELAAAGRTNAQIGTELFISVNTVEKHLSAALRKAGVGSRVELARHLLSGTKNGGVPS